MCENEWITAPSAMLTPGPITTNGSIVTSLPKMVSAARWTVSGAISVTPASSAAWRSRACITASASASWLSVDAAHFVLAGFDHDGLQSHFPDDSDGIDQIILALAVGFADPVENFKRLAAIERHHAGIAQRHLALFVRRVGMLTDRHQAVALAQQPAVAGGIGGAEAEHGQRRPLCQRRAQPRE